jgi:hypothetical protein
VSEPAIRTGQADGSGETDEESHAVFLIGVDPGTEED